VLLRGIVDQRNLFESLRKTLLKRVSDELKDQHINRQLIDKTMDELEAKLKEIQSNAIGETIEKGVEERKRYRQVALEKMKDEINNKFSELKKLERRIKDLGSGIIDEIQDRGKIRKELADSFVMKESVVEEKSLKKIMRITQMQFPVTRNFECETSDPKKSVKKMEIEESDFRVIN